MASVGGDIMCAFCCQSGSSMIDPRNLTCGHHGCFACIDDVSNAATEIECPTCSMKSEVVDVKIPEGIISDSTLPDERNKSSCSICNDKPASVFCVRCQKLLCSVHEEEDQEEAKCGGCPVHFHVKISYYANNEGLYIRHRCNRHPEKKTVQACIKCLDIFCWQCDTEGKCSSTKDLHKLTSLPDAVSLFRNQISEYKASLVWQSSRCQSLLKDTYRKMESMEKLTNQMIAEMERITKEQIEQIMLEEDKVKSEIIKYKEDFSREAEECLKQVISCDEQAVEQMRDLNKISNITSPGHMIEDFSVIRGRIEATLNTNPHPVRKKRKHLIPTGKFRNLEVKFDDMTTCSLEYNRTVRKGNDVYYSVRWLSTDQLVISSANGIELRDRELNVIKSIRIPAVHDVISYRDQLILLKCLNDKTRMIQLYSMELVKIRDIVSFSTDYNSLTQIAVVDKKIVVTDPSNKYLQVWTLEGKQLTKIDLKDMCYPIGVFSTSDGCVLVSDRKENGSVRKYNLSGDYQVVWKSDVLKYPWGITESKSGDLYVNRCQKNNQALYLLSGDGKLLKTLACGQLTCLEWVLGVSVQDDCLAAACYNDGVKLFQLKLSALDIE